MTNAGSLAGPTPAEFLDDIRGTQTAKVPAAESPEQPNTGSQALSGWRYEVSEFRRFAVQDNSDQGSAGLSQLVDDVNSVCLT
jgi:hypothetical protein